MVRWQDVNQNRPCTPSLDIRAAACPTSAAAADGRSLRRPTCRSTTVAQARTRLNCASLRQALQVGAHDVGHPAKLGRLPQLIHGDFFCRQTSLSASSAMSSPILFRNLKQSATVLATEVTGIRTTPSSNIVTTCMPGAESRTMRSGG